jgi:chromosome segregation ATPase
MNHDKIKEINQANRESYKETGVEPIPIGAECREFVKESNKYLKLLSKCKHLGDEPEGGFKDIYTEFRKALNFVQSLQTQLKSLEAENKNLKKMDELYSKCNTERLANLIKAESLQSQLQSAEEAVKLLEDANDTLRDTFEDMDGQLQKAEEALSNIAHRSRIGLGTMKNSERPDIQNVLARNIKEAEQALKKEK